MSSPTALVIDDGELQLARALLRDLDVEFEHLQGAKAEPPLPYPSQLLLATAQQAVALRCHRSRKGPLAAAAWFAFVQAESKTQRSMLRQAGFDFLIPDTVHPAALRLMMMRALFEGENTQRVKRIAIGAEASYLTNLRRQHSAVLVDLSPRGCRLLTEKPPALGSRITVRIPRGCPGGRTLDVTGQVVRTAPGPQEGGGVQETSVGVAFESIRGRQREALKLVLGRRLRGPVGFGDAAAGLRAGDDDTRTSLGAREETASEPPGLNPRGVFEREVPAICPGATRVLMGRDLSEQGMRVEPHPQLKLRTRVRLAIHGSSREEPFMIEAHVGRDDGPRGLALHFDYMEPAALERLRELIKGLPPIHRLREDTRTHTAILAQLLPSLRRR